MHWAQVVLLAVVGGVTVVALTREVAGDVDHECKTLAVPVMTRLNACTTVYAQARDDEARAMALFYRGYARHEAKDLGGALADYDESLRLEPRFSATLGARAKVYLDLGNDVKGRADLDMALAIDRSFAMGFVMRAGLHEDDGNEAAALADYDAAVRAQPNHTTSLAARGQFHFNRGRYEPALRDYDAIVSLLPTWAPGYAYRGQIHAAKGDAARAKADYEAAVRLDPGVAGLVAELQQAPTGR